MIRYALVCECGYEYEAWFSNSADFDAQADRGLVECPMCGSKQVRKQVMSPAIGGRSGKSGSGGIKQTAEEMAALANAVRQHISENFTDVGARFPEEARKMHSGESETRGIYGTATREESKALKDEGVPVADLPPGLTPEGKKKLN